MCEQRAPPHGKYAHGCISVRFIPEGLYFGQSVSEIVQRETCLIRANTTAQTSLSKDDRGRFLANDLLIKVRALLCQTRIVQVMKDFMFFEEKTVGCF